MTSCTYGFYKNGIYKVDYVHCDSSPSFFGKIFVLFIKENSIEKLKEIENKLILVQRKDNPNEKQIKELKEKKFYISKDKDEQNWENISITNGGFIEYYLKDGNFIPDFSRWRENQDWTYLINLDKLTFDVHYFNKPRWSYPLDQIPSDWYLGDEYAD